LQNISSPLIRSLSQSFCVPGSNCTPPKFEMEPAKSFYFQKRIYPFTGSIWGFTLDFRACWKTNTHQLRSLAQRSHIHGFLPIEVAHLPLKILGILTTTEEQQVLLARAATNRTKGDPKKKHHYSFPDSQNVNMLQACIFI